MRRSHANQAQRKARARGRRSISPALCVSSRCFSRRGLRSLTAPGHLRRERAQRLGHTHPCGQTLIVTAGLGWTQCWGELKEEIRPGDVVTCPPGKKHWHGAIHKIAMTHIAVQEAKDGKVVEWLEKVSDEQYLG